MIPASVIASTGLQSQMRGGGGGGGYKLFYAVVLRCSRRFLLKELSERHDLRCTGRLFQNRAPEKAMLVLNKSILGFGN